MLLITILAQTSLRFKKELTYQVDGDDLTSSLLDLAELLEEVPETGLGNDIVGSEESHAEKLRDGLLLGRKLTADNLVKRKGKINMVLLKYAAILCKLR